MREVSCPTCGHTFDVKRDDVELYEQILCPGCGSVLEVISGDPLELEEVELG